MDEIFHYASPYYDPVKAHEYYEAHKKLKGRRSTSKLDEEGKEKWAYVKDQITNEKKEKVTDVQEQKKAQIAEHRQKAKEARERITEKLKRLNAILTEKAKKEREKLAEDQKKERESVANEKAQKIEAITSNKLPAGMSKAERAYYQIKRSEEIAQIRDKSKISNQNITGSYKAKREDLSTKTKAERKTNSESAASERKQVTDNLKTVIVATREAYRKAKSNIDMKYEDIYQQEYDKILSENPKATKK